MSLIDDLQDSAEWVGQNRDKLHFTPKTNWIEEKKATNSLFLSKNTPTHVYPVESVSVDYTQQANSEIEQERINQLSQLYKSLSFRVNLSNSIKQPDTPLLKMVAESYSDDMQELMMKIEKEFQDCNYKLAKTAINVSEEKQKFIRQMISWLFSEINNTKNFKPAEALSVFTDIRRLIAWDKNDSYIGGFAVNPCATNEAILFLKQAYLVEERVCPECGKKTVHGCKACLHCGKIIGL